MNDSIDHQKQGEWLGSDGIERKDCYVAVFVPSKRRDGDPLDHSKLAGASSTCVVNHIRRCDRS